MSEDTLFDPTPYGKGREKRVTKKPDRQMVKITPFGRWTLLRNHKNQPKAHILDTDANTKKLTGRVQGHQGSYFAICGYVGAILTPDGEPVALGCADCRRITGITE